jgi:hypothetical protein
MDRLQNKKMSLGERIYRVTAAAILIPTAVRAVGVRDWFWRGDLTAPRGVHLTGWPKHLLVLAMCCAVASLVSPLVGDYRAGAFEKVCRLFSRLCAIAGWALFAASLVLYAYQYSRQ